MRYIEQLMPKCEHFAVPSFFKGSMVQITIFHYIARIRQSGDFEIVYVGF